MRILNLARSHARRFTNNGGFEVAAMLSSPSFTTPLELQVLYSRHHLAYNTDGQAVDDAQVSVSIAEADLLAGNYPYQSNGDIMLRDHKIVLSDTTGEKTYIIDRAFPDQTLGLILCILSRAHQNA